MTRQHLLLATLIPTQCGGASFELDTMASSRAQAGKAQLDELLRDSSSASCWGRAIESLTAGCKQMDDVERSRLAVQFANCHLEKSGLQTYECSESMNIAQCTGPMVASPSGLAYSTYTLFYSHAESMCFYLKSSAFQESTESAVSSLQRGTEQTAARLGQLQAQASAVVDATAAIITEQAAAAAAAEALLQGQKLAASELESLQRSQAAAFAAAEKAVAGLGAQSAAALEGLKRDTEALSSKQQGLLGGLDRLLNIQGALLGEFMDMKTIIFYTCAVLLSLALTSTPRSSAARFPIFCCLTLNVLIEKVWPGWTRNQRRGIGWRMGCAERSQRCHVDPC